MGLTVRFDARALADLAEIRDYLVARSPGGAERVRLHLLETISRLSDFPLLGRPTDEPNVASWCLHAIHISSSMASSVMKWSFCTCGTDRVSPSIQPICNEPKNHT
jgi:plasmid stabilization system protein ParE